MSDFGLPTLALLTAVGSADPLPATIEFGLVMFVVGSHIPARHHTLRRPMPTAAGRVAVVVTVAVLAVVIARGLGTGHAALCAVLRTRQRLPSRARSAG